MRIVKSGYICARPLGAILCILASAGLNAAGKAESQAALPDQACTEFNQKIFAQVEAGQLKEAETALTHALASTGDNPSCDWITLQNMSVVMSRSGRLEEAESYAARALAILDRTVPPDDLVLLRPLHTLSTTRLQLGKIAGAREAFQRLQRIRITLPIDRAMVRGAAGALLAAEGRPSEADSEYRQSIEAWEQAGLGDSAYLAATLNGLSDLYISTGRFADAERALLRALAIHASSPDTGPVDQIRILNSQAVLCARQGQWKKAEDYLRAAVTLADGTVNSVLLEPLLSNYAQVLRSNHQTKQARALEARAAALFSATPAHALVDTTQLLAEAKKTGK